MEPKSVAQIARVFDLLSTVGVCLLGAGLWGLFGPHAAATAVGAVLLAFGVWGTARVTR